MPKKHVYRIGDIVEIVKPSIFVRCGYRFDKEYAKKHLITESDRVLINQLLKDAVEEYRFHTQVDNTKEEILDRLAYYKLRVNGFGGPNRQIFTEDKPSLLNKTATVMAKKYVKTGVRDHGYTDYWGEYSPPSLMNEKTHVILKLALQESIDNVFYDYVLIEESNVKKAKQ
jgi:hypothetical protein